MCPVLNVIGAGRVGRVLARLLGAHGLMQVQDVLNRSPASSAAAVAFIGAGTPCAGPAALRRAEVWLLAVGDDQVAPCAAALAQQGLLDGSSIVFHCSGALSSRALEAAAQCGAACASVHPVRSFADPERVAREFAGTFCSIEGDAPALAVLRPALAAIGARLLAIEAAHKTLYHAASVFASNYLTSLVDVALRAYTAAGIAPAQARELAEPLLRETLENILRLGPAAALTGPIARGDFATVARQREAVEQWDPAAGALYRAFETSTIELSKKKAGALMPARQSAR